MSSVLEQPHSGLEAQTLQRFAALGENDHGMTNSGNVTEKLGCLLSHTLKEHR